MFGKRFYGLKGYNLSLTISIIAGLDFLYAAPTLGNCFVSY
jgi:hypothetical protein